MRDGGTGSSSRLSGVLRSRGEKLERNRCSLYAGLGDFRDAGDDDDWGRIRRVFGRARAMK